MSSSLQKEVKKGLCLPAVLAAILGVSGILTTWSGNRLNIAAGSLTQFAIIYALCYYGHPKAAWVVLLIVPITVVAIMVYLGIKWGGSWGRQ